MKYKILVADDEENIIEYYQTIFATPDSSRWSMLSTIPLPDAETEEVESNNTLQDFLDPEDHFSIDYVSQGEDAIAQVKQSITSGDHYALLLLDIRMPPGLDGLQTAERIRELDSNIQIFIVSAYSDYSIDTIQQALQQDVLVLQKPFYADDLLQFAADAIRSWRRGEEITTLKWRISQQAHLFDDISWSADLTTTRFFPSRSMLSILGAREGEIPTFPDFLRRLREEEQAQFENYFHYGRTTFSLLQGITGTRSQPIWLQSYGQIFYDNQGRPNHIIASCQQLARQSRGNDPAYQAYIDDYKELNRLSVLHRASGIPVRGEFIEQCQKTIHAKQHATLLLIHLNGLRDAGKKYGSLATTQLIPICVRRSSKVLQREHQFFLYTADVLALYLPGKLTRELIMAMVDRLEEALYFIHSPSMLKVRVSATIDNYQLPEQQEQVATLLSE